MNRESAGCPGPRPSRNSRWLWWRSRAVDTRAAHLRRASLTDPADLEWCEGGSLYMAWRLLHHLMVYVKLGDVFAPFPYPPAHTLALALSGWLAGGSDYGPARAVSVVSYLLLCAVLFVVVRRAFTSTVPGITAGIATLGLIACSFPSRLADGTTSWRVDSMMLAFSVLAAALVAVPGMGWGRTLGASLALVTAIFTKQTAAFFAMWICLFVLARDWREGLRLSEQCSSAAGRHWRRCSASHTARRGSGFSRTSRRIPSIAASSGTDSTSCCGSHRSRRRCRPSSCCWQLHGRQCRDTWLGSAC
ncbi:MAG: hypothetical protein QM736_14045 [Vicinamibacterales bacterium]